MQTTPLRPKEFTSAKLFQTCNGSNSSQPQPTPINKIMQSKAHVNARDTLLLHICHQKIIYMIISTAIIIFCNLNEGSLLTKHPANPDLTGRIFPIEYQLDTHPNHQ